MGKKRIIITGAAGNIGSKLRNGLSDKYDLILLDKKTIDNKNAICADLTNYDNKWANHFENVSTVIHLAGNPYEGAPWRELIPDNIDSVLNVCRACTEHNVRRLIFASSCHTMGGYRENNIDLITAEMEPFPDCDYGVSKLIGERICKSFSTRYPLSVICLRIGWVPRGDQRPDGEVNPWLRGLWLSNRDLVKIFEKSIEAGNVKFVILYAMSNNEVMNWDLHTTMKALNFTPRHGIK